jgi:septal ring factor EnvC (AmiA/AmiB activator)
MGLSLGILSLCLLLLTGSIIALCFHRLRPKAKWAASASASGFTVSLLLLGLSFDREAQQSGLVVKEICPCAEQAEVTNSTRKEEAAEGKRAEHEARRLTGVEVRQRAKLAVTEEAQARRRAEVARIEEAEARQQAKLARTEEAEARRRAEVARAEEAEARQQAKLARTEEAEARRRAEVAKGEEIEAKQHSDVAKREAEEVSRRPKMPIIIRGGRKSTQGNQF